MLLGKLPIRANGDASKPALLPASFYPSPVHYRLDLERGTGTGESSRPKPAARSIRLGRLAGRRVATSLNRFSTVVVWRKATVPHAEGRLVIAFERSTAARTSGKIEVNAVDELVDDWVMPLLKAFLLLGLACL